ncbi:hypothetical protein AVEN_205580-1 [Araneus ventricosus]|uniref:Thioredoxin domain-containing protein n=1 Tax=Araneus ventricosus TaxID=182803 RepID=A0A4Y2F9J5_ARAVE|nr:hypothetical protein AVEN_205580-1 [Araneus ventricosus]
MRRAAALVFGLLVLNFCQGIRKTIEPTNAIEDVDARRLEELIEQEEFLAVLFSPNDCIECETILKELENIDDELDKVGILLVTTDDMSVAVAKAKISKFPALVLFRNEEPVPYTGDLMDEDAILAWVTSEETLDIPDAIEEVNSLMLENLLNTSHSVAVLFYSRDDCPLCETVLQRVEDIDDDAENNDIDFVKVADPEVAEAYNVTHFPALYLFKKDVKNEYKGDLTKANEILQWLIENRDRPDSFIEDVDRRELEVLIEEHTIAVFFYDENCTTCDAILHELENIDDDSDRYDVQILKTNDIEFATELGVSSVPSFVYFEGMLPSIYDGDLMDENELLLWLIEQKTEDTIENINRDMLFRLIEEQEYLAIYFYRENDKLSKEILKHLEQIDDDCSDYEVQLLKMSDGLMAKKYRVRNPPGLVFFRHGNPIVYPGDLTDEEEVLDWLTSPDNMESSDSIEKVNRRMLERVLARCDYLAVFFYRRFHCRKCSKALEELEYIDDDAEAEGIHFVKIEDEKLGRSFGVYSMPALIFFRFGDTEDPVIYAGDLKNGSDILSWLITQKDPSSDMIEEMDGDELEELIETAEFLAVLFYDPDVEDCPECMETLADLENIDDDTDRHGILFVKTTDDSIAADYGITRFPALIYFENNVPSIYEGDISAEEEVLQWLIHSKSEDTIETVNRDMCDKLIENTPYLVVLFSKKAIQIFSNWVTSNKLEISFDKTKYMYIGKLVNPARIKWNNVRIQKVWSLKYLGVVIDSTLSWVPHIIDRGTKSLDHYHQLQRIAGKNWGLSQTNRKLIYKTVTERMICHGSVAWALNISERMKRKLNSFQRRFLLIITKAYHTTSTLSLQILTGIPPLHLTLSKEAKNIKITRLRQPAIINDSLIDPSDYEEILRGHQFHPADFKIDFRISTEPAPNYPIENSIYTDGSKTTDGTGSAFCSFDDLGQLKTKWLGKLSQDNNIFQAELLAIHQAILHHINSKTQVKIWSDSLSSLQAILNPTSPYPLVRDIQKQLQSKNNIYIGWVKAHIGHYGNETADELAKKAINEGTIINIKKPLSSLKKSLNQELLEKWQLEWNKGKVGRLIHEIIPSPSFKLHKWSRGEIMFFSEHGPFPSYLRRFNLKPTDLCNCGDVGTPLHYATSCILTESWHFKKPSTPNLLHWKKGILKNKGARIQLDKPQNKISETVLEELENIDGFTDEYGIQMVKTQDSSIARRYGVKQFPALIFFRNERPLVYKGDLLNEEAVLDWILSENTLELPDDIEEVNGKMLEKLVERHQLIAVYFCEYGPENRK